MNKSIIYSTILVVFSILVSSCINDKNEQAIEIQNLDISQKMESSYSLLDYKPNIYHDFFKESENVIGYSSLKPGPLQDFSIVESRDISNLSKKGKFIINKIEVTHKNGSSLISKDKSDAIFGKVMKISIKSEKGKSFKDGSTSKEVEMYVPEQLQISNPKITSEEELMPICYYEDFFLEWNADPKNTEGLVVVAEYTGISAVPSKDKNIHIVNTDIIKEDNGSITLDNSIWDGIPDSGVVQITLLRGNVKIENIDEENYKFFAEARTVLPIILIKDINTLE